MGIDVGKKFCSICVLDEDAECVLVDRIETLCRESWHELLKLFAGRSLHIVFEVGPQYAWMYDLLQPHCVELLVISPEEKQRCKTDRLDAAHLANDLRRGELEHIYVPPAWQRQHRRLIAALHRLSSQIAKAKTQIRDMLFVARLKVPDTDLGSENVLQALETAYKPRFEAQEQIFLQQLIDQLKLHQKQYDELHKLVPAALAQYPQAELLRSVPGFGHMTVLAILSAIGNIARFQRPEQLPHYFGLCGGVDQSGDRFSQLPITKHGNKHVRWLVGQSITHLTKKDPKAHKRYQKLKRKKPPKVARVAVMRWLLTVVWQMLTKNEKYRLNGTPGRYLKRAS